MQRNVNKKAELFRIKVTTYIQGSVKKMFVEDLIATGITEAELGRKIIEEYYSKKQGNFRNVY